MRSAVNLMQDNILVHHLPTRNETLINIQQCGLNIDIFLGQLSDRHYNSANQDYNHVASQDKNDAKKKTTLRYGSPLQHVTTNEAWDFQETGTITELNLFGYANATMQNLFLKINFDVILLHSYWHKMIGFSQSA